MKQNIDQERKLSALFKIKQSENLSPEFWDAFDSGLQKKLTLEQTKPSLVEIWRAWVRQYKIAIASFSTAMCALAAMFLSQVSSYAPRSLPACNVRRCAQAVSNAFELPNNFHNSTLALALPVDTYSQFICNNMYKSGLNNTVKELRF